MWSLQVKTNQWQGTERWLQVQTNQQAGTTFTTSTRCLLESTMLPWSRKVQPPSMNNKDTATYTVRPAWQQRWRRAHMPSTGLLRRWLSHMPPSLSDLRSLLQKVIMKWESQNGICQCSTSTSENWVYCPGRVRVKGNDWADWLAAKQPAQVACILEKIRSLKKLEKLPVGTKPITHHQSPGGERRRKRKRLTSFFKWWERALIDRTNAGMF